MTLAVPLNKQTKDYTIDIKTINNIKALVIDMTSEENNGEYLRLALRIAPIIYRLYNKHLVFDYNNPDWINRDRFIMSSGYGSALLYATLFMSGFNITTNDLKRFRKYKSITPSFPEKGITPGVDITTGTAGSSFSAGIGMALGENYLNNKFKNGKNSLIDHYTYIYCNDTDMMEGITTESSSLAGELKLGKIIVLYDTNDDLNEDVLKKYKSLGWDTHILNDSYNFEKFDNLIELSKKVKDKPSIIKIKTNTKYEKIINKEDLKKIKKSLHIRDIPYTVLKESKTHMKNSIDERNNIIINKWKKQEEKLKLKLNKNLLNDYENLIKHNNICLDEENLLKIKTNSAIEFTKELIKETNNILCLNIETSETKLKKEKYINFNSRNQAMAAVQNGLGVSGIKTISMNYLSNSNKIIPEIRMASIMNLNNIYVFTHDTVIEGEYGPITEPIEQIDMLRLIPGITVFRPCDNKEIIGSFKYAFNSNKLVVIIISKENLKTLENTDINKVKNGGYILQDNDKNDICIIASGSEVKLALKISESLEKHMLKTRIISMPSIEKFDLLSKEEQEKILPKKVIKVVLELSPCKNYYKYISQEDLIFNVTNFIEGGNKYSMINRLSYSAESITSNIISNITQRK